MPLDLGEGSTRCTEQQSEKFFLWNFPEICLGSWEKLFTIGCVMEAIYYKTVWSGSSLPLAAAAHRAREVGVQTSHAYSGGGTRKLWGRARLAHQIPEQSISFNNSKAYRGQKVFKGPWSTHRSPNRDAPCTELQDVGRQSAHSPICHSFIFWIPGVFGVTCAWWNIPYTVL